MTLATKNIRKNNGERLRDSAVHTTDSLTSKKVMFYKLTKKFVEVDSNVDQKSADVINYALSTGHNTGVVDVFEPCLEFERRSFDDMCDKLSSKKLKNKFSGVEKFGEIVIDRADAIDLKDDLNDEHLNKKISKLIESVISSNQMYLIVRRVSR